MTRAMSDTGLQASMVQGGNAKLMLQGLSREIRVEGLEGFLQGHLSILWPVAKNPPPPLSAVNSSLLSWPLGSHTQEK